MFNIPKRPIIHLLDAMVCNLNMIRYVNIYNYSLMFVLYSHY